MPRGYRSDLAPSANLQEVPLSKRAKASPPMSTADAARMLTVSKCSAENSGGRAGKLSRGRIAVADSAAETPPQGHST
jgi:hypothetical protein